MLITLNIISSEEKYYVAYGSNIDDTSLSEAIFLFKNSFADRYDYFAITKFELNIDPKKYDNFSTLDIKRVSSHDSFLYTPLCIDLEESNPYYVTFLKVC